MKNKKIHRNITMKRLALDFGQFMRCQALPVRLFGKPFQRSRRFVEIDLTNRCNLTCLNCNRSCTQNPSRMEIPVDTIESFIHPPLCYFAARKIQPTLHGTDKLEQKQ